MPGAVSAGSSATWGDKVAALAPVRGPHESNGGRGRCVATRHGAGADTEDTVSPWLSPTACQAR